MTGVAGAAFHLVEWFGEPVPDTPPPRGVDKTTTGPGRSRADLRVLVHAAAEGDLGAWNELVRRYAELVWRVARSHRLGEADASDVSQATWLRLTQYLHRLTDPDRLPGWLVTTAHRESLRVLAVRRRELPVELLPEAHRPLVPQVRLGDPEEGVERAERLAAVRRAFGLLPERCRRLLGVLAAAPEWSYRQVADALGVAVGTVGPARSRCLRHFRALVTTTPGRVCAAGPRTGKPVEVAR